MAHNTYCSALFNCVFSTKNRRRWIPPEAQTPLAAYMTGLARNHAMKLLAAGGMEDHQHLLLSLPATIDIATAMRTMKSSSSHWLRESCLLPNFAWQEGYGAFSVGKSQIETTINYIGSQPEHHRKHDYQQEFLSILAKHEIAYDPQYVWG